MDLQVAAHFAVQTGRRQPAASRRLGHFAQIEVCEPRAARGTNAKGGVLRQRPCAQAWDFVCGMLLLLLLLLLLFVACVCVCVRVCARARARAFVCVYVCVCVCVCVVMVGVGCKTATQATGFDPGPQLESNEISDGLPQGGLGARTRHAAAVVPLDGGSNVARPFSLDGCAQWDLHTLGCHGVAANVV